VKINKLWLDPLVTFAEAVDKPAYAVIERALFHYFRHLLQDHPNSTEGQAARRALDQILSTTHIPK
jgi:hypothetical protein